MSGVTLTGDWDRFDRLTDDAQFRRRMRHHLKRAWGRIGELHVRNIRTAISSGNYHANAPLTVAIKKSSKPLVDRGNLIRAVSYQARTTSRGGGELYVGIKRTGRYRGNAISIAAALHEGFSIRVTPRVRAAVFAKLRKRRGKRFFKRWQQNMRTAGMGRQYWVVPPRPFIEGPVNQGLRQSVNILAHAYRGALLGGS